MQAASATVNDVVLAMLNVIQTVALAYLAADRRAENAARRELDAARVRKTG